MNSVARVAYCLIAAALWALAVPSPAQNYPSKPIRWIVPSAPGGAFDLLTRALATPLTASFGQPIVVDNRAAVSGITGMEATAHAAPDGYTLLTAGNPQLVFNKHFYAKLPYDPQKDFAPVTLLANLPFALFVHQSVPVKNLAELLAYARANPAKLNYGTPGVGQAFHLAMELLKQRTGTDFVHVPYKGAGPALQDFFAGRVQLMFYPATSQVLAEVKEGRLRPIAAATERRIPALPETPTFEESGIPNLDRDIIGWVGIVAPAGTPRDLVSRLNRDIVRAAALPEMTKVYAAMNVLPATTTPEELAQKIDREIALWGPVIKGLKIELE